MSFLRKNEIIATNKNQISTNLIFDINVLDIDEPIFSISSEFSGTKKEGQEIIALVSTKFIPANTNIFWTLSGSNIDSNDISDGKLNGELKLDKNGNSNFDLIFLDDDVVEGTEIAELNIFSDAKMNNENFVEIWGTGKPIREWLYVQDGANALIKSSNSEDC